MADLDPIPLFSQTTSALSCETIDKDTNKRQDDVKLKQLRAENGTENHIGETLSGDNSSGNKPTYSTASGKALLNKHSTYEASSQLSKIVKEDGDITHEPTAGASEEKKAEADSTNYTGDRQKVTSSWWILCKQYRWILFISCLPLLAGVVAFHIRPTIEIDVTLSPSLAVTAIHRHRFPNGWTIIRRYPRLLLVCRGAVKRIFRS